VALLDDARAQGITVVGLDASAPGLLREVDLTGPTLIVLGGEHEGLGRGVKRALSVVARLLPMHHVDSLNVSVAAALALYEARVQRGILGTSIPPLG
jgi:tRNA G18 (ribose-2'-O)-methylase SpoU